MKLHSFEHKNNYTFILGFADHSFIEADLSPLLKAYVEPSAINTAKIDSEWGCLIFNDGMVDIEPRTLYKFAVEQGVYHPDKKDTHF
ncbi:DUF2442 domain-containing protein [Oceanospirillum beijerinckii]|uniref:DUF2442 domain-containing protein n=1 Tax=Oceanospirillum beijerinckii TaxID=64976 RepID=UPI00040329E1|nr:DUF2442 domain-containing protein [Oceanospirillum beijerinckii]